MPFLINPFVFGTGGGGAGSAFKRAITIDHTKVGSSDQTNFPVLVSGTYSYLATVANGGKVQNGSGYDVEFFSDSALSTKLAWETELYTAGTGQVVYWVKVPSVSHTADTVFYVRYGDSGVTTDQSNATGTWDSNYRAVYHLKDGSTLDTTDSTSNNNDSPVGNNGGTLPTATTGKIDGAANFDSSLSQVITVDTNASLGATDHFSLSCWYKPNNFSTYRTLMLKGNGSVRNYAMDTEVTTGKLRVVITQGSLNFKVGVGATGLTTGTWAHCAATYDGANLKVLLNGVVDGTQAQTGNADSPGGGDGMLAIGREGNTANSYADGIIDEVRVSIGIARTADWFLTEYNNQNSPSTFYAVGAETPA